MIAIPNMSKPKDSCWECKAQYNSVCSLKREHIRWDGILDDCPLIEIVECKDCKYWTDDMSGNMWCEHAIGGLTEPTDFCSYGERKPISDERLEFWEKVYKEESR